MAVLLVLLLLLAVPLTAFKTTDVYYVTADDAASHEQSCPPHQICHNLSYYIFQPDHYFTSDTTIIFLEGEHSFNSEDLVQVINVHNLTLKGQGQWPVAGPEETVMQSTVIINCSRGRGGFYFLASHNITVEGLTVVNCGGIHAAVFEFYIVYNMLFLKNSIQHMTGRGLFIRNSNNVLITNCSYYHSISSMSYSGVGGVGISYELHEYTSSSYTTLELSYSNITKCGNSTGKAVGSTQGGEIFLQATSTVTHYYYSGTVILSHLILSQNRADQGGNLGITLTGHGKMIINISNCLISHAAYGGGMYIYAGSTESSVRIENTHLVENNGIAYSEIQYQSNYSISSILTFSFINSSIIHTKTQSLTGVGITGCCPVIEFTKTKVTLSKQLHGGFYIYGTSKIMSITECQFEESHNVGAVLYAKDTGLRITNSTFSNNTGDHSVIVIDNHIDSQLIIITNSTISHNNMTGITITNSKAPVHFSGHNVIQNSRDTEGAGIKLKYQVQIIREAR